MILEIFSTGKKIFFLHLFHVHLLFLVYLTLNTESKEIQQCTCLFKLYN